MQLVTNTNLAQQIIARYTHFLSYAAGSADLTWLALPISEQPQNSIFEQRQEIRHIRNCIEQNTMISVNLNLQFLNQMMTHALQQISGEHRRAVQMLERPMLLERSTETQMIRVDAPTTKILLRELQRWMPQSAAASLKVGQTSPDPARVLLLRSLTQLTTRAERPVMLEFPAPTVQSGAEVTAPSQMRSSALIPTATRSEASQMAQPLLPAQNLLHTAVESHLTEESEALPARIQNVERVSPIYESPSPIVYRANEVIHPAAAHDERQQASLAQPPRTLKSLASRPEKQVPTSQTSSAAIPLFHPTAQLPIQPHTTQAMPPSVTALLLPTILQKDTMHPEQPAATPSLQLSTQAAIPAVTQLPVPQKTASVMQPPTAFHPSSMPKTDILHAENPVVTPLLHPAMQMAAQPSTVLLPSTASQTAEAFHQEHPAATPLLHPATQMAVQPSTVLLLPTVPQTEAFHQGHPAAPPLLHPAKQMAAQPPTALKIPAARRQAAVLRPVDQLIPALQLHPHTAEKSSAARRTTNSPSPANRIPAQSHMTLKTPMKQVAISYPAVSLLARFPISDVFLMQHAQIMPPMHDAPAPERSQLNTPRPNGVGVLSRIDMPTTRILRAEPLHIRQRSAQEQDQDDSMDIPTVRVKKVETQETQEKSIHQNIAINAPQERPAQAIRSELSPVLPEAEIIRITNQVYRAIEGRLHSEKMRRGMW